MSGTLALIPIKEGLKHCQNVGLKSEYYLWKSARLQFCQKKTLCTAFAFPYTLKNPFMYNALLYNNGGTLILNLLCNA